MNRIKELRKQAGLTQKELSRKTSIGLRTLQNWEQEIVRVDPARAHHLAEYFDVNLSYLLGFTDKPDSNLRNLLFREVRKLKHIEAVRLGQKDYISENAVLNVIDKYVSTSWDSR